MTNRPMNIRSAADLLAQDLADHPRIHTMIIDRDFARASTTLYDRMTSLLGDYAQGEVDSTDDHLLLALNILNSSWGPQAKLEMRLRAIHFIDCIPR